MAKLFISFWNICLDNLPEGNFRRRPVPPADARRCIEEARQTGGLVCVSEHDLIAPFRKGELENHEALCRVLGEHYGITLSIEDFCSKSAEGDDALYFIHPLSLAAVTEQDRLLIVTCNYGMRETTERKKGEFPLLPIAVDSVRFHLIESV
jgi:hypothetical protein